MRVVVVGASGNIGSASVHELAAAGHEVVGVARRPPLVEPAVAAVSPARWAGADVATTDLVPLFEGADVVVHLAWLFQPTHDPDLTWSTNAVGTRRVLDAVAAAGVPAVVVASSVAAYSPGPPGRRVDETWPTDGPAAAAYAREKAYVERLLDLHEAQHPERRVVRLRPAFVFQRAAATSQRRLFAGPLVPGRLLDPSLLGVLPVPRGLRLQTVHAADVGRAVAAAVGRPVSGAFNLAADEVLDRDALAEVFDARPVDVPPALVRRAVGVAWQLHLLPVPTRLFDALMAVPEMSTARARAELDWTPRHTAREALEAFLDGVRHGAGSALPPLDPAASGPLRAHEFATGVGSRP